MKIVVKDHSDELLSELKRMIKAALEAVGIQAEGYAQDIIDAKVPRHAKSWYVSKGAAGLRGSITHAVQADEKTLYVGTNNEHAIYNELGTGVHIAGGRKSPWKYQDDKGNWHQTTGITPLHFLKNAMSEHEDEYKAIIEKILKG